MVSVFGWSDPNTGLRKLATFPRVWIRPSKHRNHKVIVWSTMLFQVVTVEQCCNNMLTMLFIVGRTTLFTPSVDINLEQVVDFLNFYTCIKFNIPDKVDLHVSKSVNNFGISAHRESFLAFSISSSTPLVCFFAILKYFTSR
jgi:hypothetical protein